VDAHTDIEIVMRVNAGETAAFGELYRKYHARLLGYCARLLKDREKAEEVVQAAFVKALESLGSLERPELFSSWLFTIARNGVYGHFRAARQDGAADDVWDTDTPYERAVAGETSALVEQGLGRLKPEYREVLVLRHFERMSYREIAAVTGTTVSSVESRLFKARKALLKYLEPYVRERSIV
jgi:RNA polymerase sigma-70 factor (ECF subfamily)